MIDMILGPYLAWTIYELGSCYGQDSASLVRRDGWDRVVSYYGAVTDLASTPSCSLGGYSEDIWVTWTTDGRIWGQRLGVNPPFPILTSSDVARKFGKGAGGCKTCTGWHVGDPTVEPLGNLWVMLADIQSCAASKSGAFEGVILATSNNAFGGWEIRRLVDAELPGVRPHHFPKLWHDPGSGVVYLTYADSHADIRMARVERSGPDVVFVPLWDGQAILDDRANVLVPFRARGSWWAVTDNFGLGRAEDLTHLWLLGPASDPWGPWDWSTRRELLAPGRWSGRTAWLPHAISASDSPTGRAMVTFNGSGEGGPCAPFGAAQSYLLEVEP